ncbi:PepSY domain-containing protein [Cohnella cellulosilytica]|uniref:YcdB/YcdC domain-containing protein n=1 Tax=Cohnella cellulosilytica TaxID=986710 RepID=A0ABW2FMH0_9BACL
MTIAPNVHRSVRTLTALLIASALLTGLPESGRGSSVPQYEEAPGSDYGEVGPDPAAVPISKEAAIRLAKEALPPVGNRNPDDIGLLYRRTEKAFPSIPVWKGAWDMLDKGTVALAEIDAVTGDLLSYETRYLMNPMNEPNSRFPARITRDRAKEAAEAFVRKAVPSVRDFGLKELAFTPDEAFDYVYPLFGPARYSFRFGLTVNGYETINVPIAVVLDAGGSVKAFSFAGHPGQPVAKRAAVKAEEAKRIWANGFRMLPLYRNVAGSFGDSPDWKLTYVMNRTFLSIDAMSGAPAWSDSYGDSNIAAQRYESLLPTDASFVPRSVDLKQAVQSTAALANFPSGTEWTSDSETNGGQRRTWELKGVDPDDREGGYYSLTVDAKTGQTLDYADYRYSGSDADERSSEPPTIQAADARKLAELWLTEHIPDFSSRYKLAVPFEAAASGLTLEYRMFHRGIPVAGQDLFITLNGSGKMTRLILPQRPPEAKALDALKPTLDAEQAKKRIVRQTKLLPYYVPDEKEPSTSGTTGPGERRLELLYLAAPANPYELYVSDTVDAVSGIVAPSYAGKAFTVGGPLPADALAHPSKKALQTLFDHSVLLADSKGQLLPDAGLSRGEFLRMVHKGMTFSNIPYTGGGERFFSDVDAKHPYYFDVDYFIGRKWLTPDRKTALKPDDPLTREQMAVWLTRVMGNEKMALALAEDPTVTRLRDAGKIKDKGAAAVALKFGLLKPTAGAFKPAERATRAEAAEALLKLAEMQEKLDKPLWSWGYTGDEYR